MGCGCILGHSWASATGLERELGLKVTPAGLQGSPQTPYSWTGCGLESGSQQQLRMGWGSGLKGDGRGTPLKGGAHGDSHLLRPLLSPRLATACKVGMSCVCPGVN